MQREIEIKFRVADVRALMRQLRAAGFRVATRRTHEMNTLYDLPGEVLRKRKELLRIRKYGSAWTLTHKSVAPYRPPQQPDRVGNSRRGRKEDGRDSARAWICAVFSLRKIPRRVG